MESSGGTRDRLKAITAEVYASSVREVRNIGTGSFGSALLVEVAETRERLVAKKISLEHLADKDREKALNEAALLRSLSHQNITECVPPGTRRTRSAPRRQGAWQPCALRCRRLVSVTLLPTVIII